MSKYLNISIDTTLGGNSPSDEVVASQKALKTYIDNNSGGGSVAIDGTTITKNSSDQIQAVAVIDQNAGVAKTWTGLKAEYDAIVTKDPETEYLVTDDIGGPATVIAELAEAVNDKVDVGHEVIAFQAPTSANNYTWYRKYADGWVEQGCSTSSSGNTVTVNLPIEMAGTNYTAVVTINYDSNNQIYPRNIASKATTSFVAKSYNDAPFGWMVCGMAA